jgi:hypothetical protein
MSESARNPRAQAKKRGELTPLTAERRADQGAERATRAYLRNRAGQIENPSHFEQVMSEVQDTPPGMKAAVRKQLLALLPQRVVREMVVEGTPGES